MGEPTHVGFWPIVLKKPKMPRQQNSRKSKLIADFGWRCPLDYVARSLNESAQVKPVPHVPKCQAHQWLLTIGPNAGEDFFNTIGPLRTCQWAAQMSASKAKQSCYW